MYEVYLLLKPLSRTMCYRMSNRCRLEYNSIEVKLLDLHSMSPKKQMYMPPRGTPTVKFYEAGGTLKTASLRLT